MKAVILFLSLLTVGCSSFRKTALVSMAGGFAGGYMAGHQLAPEGDNRNLHGLLVGSAVSSLVGVGMIYLMNEDGIIREKNLKIQELRKKLENSSPRNKSILDYGSINNLSLNGQKKLPSSIKKLIHPGNWKLYKLDEWKKVDESTLVHMDKELVFEAPKIKEN
jgi:hypothetical protein